MLLSLHTFLSLDGVMQGPGAPDEDTSDGFTRGGWVVPYVDEDMGRVVDACFAHGEPMSAIFGADDASDGGPEGPSDRAGSPDDSGGAAEAAEPEEPVEPAELGGADALGPAGAPAPSGATDPAVSGAAGEGTSPLLRPRFRSSFRAGSR